MSEGRCAVLAAITAIAGIAASNGGAQRRYVDPDAHWRMSYPNAFEIERYEITGRHHVSGVSVANFDPPPVQQPGVIAEPLPRGGILIRIGFDWSPGLKEYLRRSDSQFPLSLRAFAPFLPQQEQPLWASFQANGLLFFAYAWLDPGVSEADTAALARIVGSFRPGLLRAGTIAPACAGFVLRKASAYSPRSVIRFRERDLPASRCFWRRPFFLVHAPRGLYTVAGRSYNPNGSVGCLIRFDSRRFQFYCPRNGARWNRLGRPVVKPAKGKHLEPLSACLPITTFDGHLLVLTRECLSVSNLWRTKLSP
ncbi:MAG: hypothetical protein M3R26_05415 [Actinomycetota bacterium]|nr:hypothetical protein [Actinomycetota bacterium]